MTGVVGGAPDDAGGPAGAGAAVLTADSECGVSIPFLQDIHSKLVDGTTMKHSESGSTTACQKKEIEEEQGSNHHPQAAPSALSTWSMHDVLQWLAMTPVPLEVAEVLKNNAITGAVLETITDKDLQSMGIEKFGWRRQFFMSRQELIDRCTQCSTEAAECFKIHSNTVTPSTSPRKPLHTQPVTIPEIDRTATPTPSSMSGGGCSKQISALSTANGAGALPPPPETTVQLQLSFKENDTPPRSPRRASAMNSSMNLAASIKPSKIKVLVVPPQSTQTPLVRSPRVRAPSPTQSSRGGDSMRTHPSTPAVGSYQPCGSFSVSAPSAPVLPSTPGTGGGGCSLAGWSTPLFLRTPRRQQSGPPGVATPSLSATTQHRSGFCASPRRAPSPLTRSPSPHRQDVHARPAGHNGTICETAGYPAHPLSPCAFKKGSAIAAPLSSRATHPARLGGDARSMSVMPRSKQPMSPRIVAVSAGHAHLAHPAECAQRRPASAVMVPIRSPRVEGSSPLWPVATSSRMAKVAPAVHGRGGPHGMTRWHHPAPSGHHTVRRT